MPKVIDFTFNPFQEKTYAVWEHGEQCLVIDPGFFSGEEKDCFFKGLEQRGLVPGAVLLTHAHFDHIYGVCTLQKLFPGLPVYMNPAEKPVLEHVPQMCGTFRIPCPDCSFNYTGITEGTTLETCGMMAEVISTPGHTPGGLSYLIRNNDAEDLLFSGDTLFAGAIGRTDFMYGEYDDEIRSIMEKLIILDPSTIVYPGHGPATTIGNERTGNPFLEPFNEPEEEPDPDASPVIIRGN